MTGIGRTRGRVGALYLLVEAKSINHRFCEVLVHLPPRYQALEYDLICMVKRRLSRGKVEITVAEEKRGFPVPNKKLLKSYYLFLRKIGKELKLDEPITLNHLLAGSGSWMGYHHHSQSDFAGTKKLVDTAITLMIAMRRREGGHLQSSIVKHLSALEALRLHVVESREDLAHVTRERLMKRIEKNFSGLEVDPSRIAQEVVFFADKSDVDEEVERLSSHHLQMRRMLTTKKPVGRELDFLIQEMNREWNTVASKSQGADISHRSIEAKTILEKIREQVQNIE